MERTQQMRRGLITLAGTVVLMAGPLLLVGPGAAFAQSAAEKQYSAAEKQYSSAPAPASAPASASPSASSNPSPDYVGGSFDAQAITPATTIVGGNPYQPPASSTPATTIVGGNPLYLAGALPTPATAIQGWVQQSLNQPSGTTWLSGPGNWTWMGCDDPDDVDNDGRACTDTNPNNPNE